MSQFHIKFPHQKIKAFNVRDHEPLTTSRLKKLINENLNIPPSCTTMQQPHNLSVYNSSTNSSFSLYDDDKLDLDDEIIPINKEGITTLDIKVKLCGGGNTPSSNQSSDREENPSQNTKIIQKIDRQVSSEVKSKIVFDPDTVPESDCYQIPIHEFVRDKWIVKTSKLKNINSDLTSFKVLTFNVWFDLQDREDRMIKIIDICKDCNADIVCLQEMTKGTLEIMTNLSYVRENFYISDSVEFGNRTVMPYEYANDKNVYEQTSNKHVSVGNECRIECEWRVGVFYNCTFGIFE
ncbi:predicted protein [Naegleria gruberi]|uniref:Predicted protein n=1 Tax=Naegleria gruberi TaxID=5762 RepID=D2VQT7_NAEGR|nr:uncharacterized protein NAEGRDRAFT_71342 [Naegleria gruberi]EFC40767.1 predicted protein [Naegleria gruberi]|eukprot:XP_002673511.1 predicted protein [Naegleria gruberi strain NEG-M]